MSWMDDDLRRVADSLANNFPLTDGRDLKGPMKATMEAKNADLFVVPDDILKDKRTKIGIKYASRDMKGTILKPYHREPGMPWPGIVSVDPRYDEFKYGLAMQASKQWEPNIDEQGFADTSAVTADFSGLLTATGAKMSMANSPLLDRTNLLAEMGYAQDFVNPRHRRIARAIHRAMFGRRVEAPMKFNVRSSTGMPSGYGGPGSQAQKQHMARRNIAGAERLLQAVDKLDLETLFVDHGFFFAMNLVERAQAEGVPDFLSGNLKGKDRVVNSPEYALSNGAKGFRGPADKELITRGMFGLKYGLGARIRTAYGVCGEISYFMTPWLVGCRQNYFHEFGYTWHHTSSEQIFEGIKDFEELIGLDVTMMDQNMPKFFLDYHADWCEDYMDPRFAKLLRLVNGLPYFAPQSSAGASPFWAGNPLDPSSFTIDVGLSSGRADNPDLGKWYMTTVYFCLLDDYLHDLLEQGPNDDASIQRVLKGEHPTFGLKDMGDDAILGLRPGNSVLAAKIRSDLKKAGEVKKASLSPYAILDLEDGVAFLGNVIIKDEAGKIVVPKPNPVTFLVNQFCPERSINGQYSMYWGHGYLAALEHYSRAGSIIGDLRMMINDLWRHHLPGVATPEQMANAARRENPLPVGDALSQADLEVLIDPSKLYYKFAGDGDVSEHIDKLFRATIEAEFIEEHLGQYWR